MSTADYLRRQAEACLRIARGCFDLAAAERMRHLAAELRAKADEGESENQLLVEPHLMGRDDPSNWRTDRS